MIKNSLVTDVACSMLKVKILDGLIKIFNGRD